MYMIKHKLRKCLELQTKHKDNIRTYIQKGIELPQERNKVVHPASPICISTKSTV